MKEELFARLSQRYLALGIHRYYSQKIQRVLVPEILVQSVGHSRLRQHDFVSRWLSLQ